MRPMTVACRRVLTDEVRRHCAAVAASARHVRIDPDAEIDLGGIVGPRRRAALPRGAARRRHPLRADPRRDQLRVSGWFGELGTSTDALTARLTAHARAEGPWTPAQLRALDAGCRRRHARPRPGPSPHAALRRSAEPPRRVPAGSSSATSAKAFAAAPHGDAVLRRCAASTSAPRSPPTTSTWRASPTSTTSRPADDLRRQPGPARPAPRRRPALRRTSSRRASTPASSCPPAASSSASCARAPCTPARRSPRRAGVAPATLDNWLWNRGQQPPYSERPAHVTRTVYY